MLKKQLSRTMMILRATVDSSLLGPNWMTMLLFHIEMSSKVAWKIAKRIREISWALAITMMLRRNSFTMCLWSTRAKASSTISMMRKSPAFWITTPRRPGTMNSITQMIWTISPTCPTSQGTPTQSNCKIYSTSNSIASTPAWICKTRLIRTT